MKDLNMKTPHTEEELKEELNQKILDDIADIVDVLVSNETQAHLVIAAVYAYVCFLLEEGITDTKI